MSVPGPLTVEEWRAFLTAYGREVLALPDEGVDEVMPDGVLRTVPRFSPEVRESGWLGHEPCGEGEIRALEERLGRPLPPSFRSFYLVSNGWLDAGPFGEDVWPIQEVTWLRDGHSGFLIEAWSDVLAEEQVAMLRVSLLIGYADGGAGDYWLLSAPDPASGKDAEWIALRWAAGSAEDPEPFESFGALMAAQRAARQQDA